MKTRKAIAYAYPTSNTAELLGFSEKGCWFVQTQIMLENGEWSTPSADTQAGGFESKTDADLIASFIEADGEECPLFLRYADKGLLYALSLAKGVNGA